MKRSTPPTCRELLRNYRAYMDENFPGWRAALAAEAAEGGKPWNTVEIVFVFGRHRRAVTVLMNPDRASPT